MARIVTVEIDGEQEAVAEKLRAVWGASDADFWPVVVARGLELVAAIQEGDKALEESEKVQGPPQLIKSDPDGEIPF